MKIVLTNKFKNLKMLVKKMWVRHIFLDKFDKVSDLKFLIFYLHFKLTFYMQNMLCEI